MTSDESKVAVLESKMETTEKQVEELNTRVVRAIERLEAMLTRHDTDIVILKEDREDRKRMYGFIMAAIIGALIEPIIIGVAIWIAIGAKGVTAVSGGP